MRDSFAGKTFRLCALLLLLSCWSVCANAAATLLLEEPFGRLGAFTGTGHAAVYLSRVCASSPTVLRRCTAQEPGIVLSRYNGVAGYDWIAIPLIPYLYAVEDRDDVPLFADPKIVAFLRNQYRRKHLESVAPDGMNGETPGGNWVQLIGSAYERTIYAYQMETSEERDDELIRKYNSAPNRSRYRSLSSNCADFAREVIDFYYPKAVRRSVMADAAITTPKQIAKSFVKFSTRHPEIEVASYVIPQVPGTVKRSTPVRGVLESLLKTKKYVVPLVALHPMITGFLAVAYIGGGRFNPAHNAMVMSSNRELEPPLPTAERRAYQDRLELLVHGDSLQFRRNKEMWQRLQAHAEPAFDDSGKPVLQMQVGKNVVEVGLSRDNILSDPATQPLAEEMLTARLREELRPGDTPRSSQSDVVSDWTLLQQVLPPKPGLN